MAPEANPILTPPVHFCPTSDGRIIAVNGVDRGVIYVPGEGWYPLGFLPPLAGPTVTTSSGGNSYGGTYWVAYRWLDKWGNPSNLSPIVEVDTTYQQKFNIVCYASNEDRQAAVQIFRTCVDTPGTFYLVHEQFTSKGQQLLVQDTLSDADLLDRPSLPVFYDDGRLYANAYDPPPKKFRVCVQFGDRYLYAVSPEDATLRNVVCFSEPGEPEAVPFSQNSIRLSLSTGDDYIRAVGVFGASVYILTTRNCYRWVWGGDVYRDYTIVHVGPRGALNQQCVVAGQNHLYGMDHGGIWRVSREGEIEEVSTAVADYWIDSKIDFDNLDLPFLLYDYGRRTVRAFVKFRTDGVTVPQNAICYCERTGACWTEYYPNHLLRTGGTLVVEGRPEMVVAGDGGVYRVDQRNVARDSQQYTDTTPAVAVQSYIITDQDINGSQIDLYLETIHNGVRYTAKRPVRAAVQETKQTRLRLASPLDVVPSSGTASFGGYTCAVLGGGYTWVVLECPPDLENGFPQSMVGQVVTFTSGPASGRSRYVSAIETSWLKLATTPFNWVQDYGTQDVRDWVAAVDGFYRSTLYGTVHSPSWTALLTWLMDNSQFVSAPGAIPFEYVTPPFLLPVDDVEYRNVPVTIYFDTAPVEEWFNLQILDHNGQPCPLTVQLSTGSYVAGPDYLQVNLKRVTAEGHDVPGIVRVRVPVTGHRDVIGQPWIRIKIFGNQSNFPVRIRSMIVGSQSMQQAQPVQQAQQA